MTMDTNNQGVQSSEPASPTVPASQPQPGTVPPVEVKTTEPPKTVTLEETKFQQMITQAAEAAALKAAEAAKEIGRRELQSAQDRNAAERARLQRRAQTAERTLTAAKQQIERVEPEIAKDLELIGYREQDKELRALEQEEAAQKAQEEFHTQFNSGLQQYISAVGVDPNDKRIDWAADSKNYIEAQSRILASVSKIQKETTQATIISLESQLKELKGQINKVNVEANSVETNTSPGVVAGSDAEFVKRFANDEIKPTKENIDRYNKILATY